MAKEIIKNSQNPIEWYSTKRSLYEQLASKVESILQEIIEDSKISIHAINSRAKEISSFSDKINNSKYTDPINEITDFAGIRIITYVESDLEKVSKLIEDHFQIDPHNSINKTESLGTDKVGYRSIHYVAKLSRERTLLPEYSKFNNLFFEIQVRTILQHAWAEIEHDKDYKFSGELPINIKRRFKLLSGVLELADREFDTLALEIDNYEKEVNKSTKIGNLKIELNSTSLDAFLEKKFSEYYKLNKIKSSSDSREIIHELRDFGIGNIEDLDKIIDDQHVIQIIDSSDKTNSITGILRSLMMLNDIEKYFRNSWKDHWGAISKSTYDLLKKKEIDIDKYISENKILLPPK